jgi:hypothetical protein
VGKDPVDEADEDLEDDGLDETDKDIHGSLQPSSEGDEVKGHPLGDLLDKLQKEVGILTDMMAPSSGDTDADIQGQL